MRHLRLLLGTALALALAGRALAGPVDDAKRLSGIGRHADAAKAWREALQAAPGSREAMLGLVREVTDGKLSDAYEEAAGLLRAALKAKADDREARVALGNLYLAWTDVDDRYRADVQDQFERLLKANPDDEDAVVGIARMHYAGADHKRGLETLDALIARRPGSTLALYWKGQLLYDLALVKQQEAGQATPEVNAGLQQAYDAFAASTKADPKRFDAWLKLGYCAQRLVGTDPSMQAAAAAAYEKALEADGDSDLAMRGLSSLYAREAGKWGEVLPRLAKDHPKAPIVQFWMGYSQLQQGKTADAEASFRAFVKTSRTPSVGWSALGKILAGKNDEAGAKKAFEESLRADPMGPGSADAVEGLQKPFLDRSGEAVRDAKKAKDLAKDWEAVSDLSPQNISLHNNLAFFCREAFGGTKDRALLDLSVKHYVAAATLVGAYREEFATIPYPTRHGYAQVLNDTGLMFQYYKEVEDLKKAEAYYRAAMEWSQHGYWDTFGNLLKILVAAERWQDAADFANACAEGLNNPDGTPNETWRATAHGKAAEFEARLANK